MDIVADIGLMARCLDYFEFDLGYTRVELPWAVSHLSLTMTNPRIHEAVLRQGHYLVASAEQAFLEQELLGNLPAGKYVALTPCFRPGDNKEPYHQDCFYKIELYRTDSYDRLVVDEMLLEVSEFVRRELRAEEFELEVIDTPDQDQYIATIDLQTEKSCDINLNGIEIGSYGLRNNSGYMWAYGTGLAEPRFSQARRKV